MHISPLWEQDQHSNSLRSCAMWEHALCSACELVLIFSIAAGSGKQMGCDKLVDATSGDTAAKRAETPRRCSGGMPALFSKHVHISLPACKETYVYTVCLLRKNSMQLTVQTLAAMAVACR